MSLIINSDGSMTFFGSEESMKYFKLFSESLVREAKEKGVVIKQSPTPHTLRREVLVTSIQINSNSPHDFVPYKYILPGVRMFTRGGEIVTVMERLDTCTHCGVDGSYIELVLDKELQIGDLLYISFSDFKEEFIIRAKAKRSIK